MNEGPVKPVTLTNDTHVLQQIKHLQFRKQLIPILVIAFCLALSILVPQINTLGIPNFMFYPSLAAFGWYIWERIMWRTKNKIAVPEPGTFVAPVNGRISSIKKGEDVTEIVISKAAIDIVELRLPFNGLRLESNRNWFFDTTIGQVHLQIDSKQIAFFENKDVPGTVIGVLPGSAILTLRIPSHMKVLVKKGQAVFGGETVLFSLMEMVDKTQSILVEEPMEEMSETEDSIK